MAAVANAGREGRAEPPRLSAAGMLAYSLANFGGNMVNAFSNTALPLYLGAYQLPNWLIGLLAQERSLVGGFIQPVVGALSDRTRTPLGRRRPFFLVGVPLTAASLIILALHPPVWAVLAVMPFFAFFLAIANDPYLALMADITPLDQRGTMGGWMALLNMLGQVTLLLLAAALWQSQRSWVFAALVVGLVLGFGLTFLLVKEPPPQTWQVPPRRIRYRPIAYVRNILAHRELSKYVGSQLFFWLGNGAAVPFLTRFAVEVLGVAEGEAFLLVFVAVASTASLALPAGWLGSRFGKQRVLSVGLFAFVPVAMVGSQVQTVAQTYVAMACLGACNAAGTALLFPLLADLMPTDRRGELTGVGSLVWSLAQPVGSFTAGVFIDATGTYRAVFVVAGLLFAASFVLLRTVKVDPGQAAAGA
jgi:Na+/melibiose symporter-like transporter